MSETAQPGSITATDAVSFVGSVHDGIFGARCRGGRGPGCCAAATRGRVNAERRKKLRPSSQRLLAAALGLLCLSHKQRRGCAMQKQEHI